ncbi:MAG: hypothetical protein A2654_00015 [Candidatus Nealsonbacteria bacterium RIFCSPHIGHO2_01_FULL_43_31]|uniref:Uncharacterized protein n=1 Tax=Candidatus Nealsonbacteria bacterium RIFCSPHIGHO2_01_FULL_43_31 TaxID=1801665 RepID=A0A1G2E3U8_9BACT|nr:MAG: hypothetical protein A2654_00015 [Candidatus Nealsonbacteria bacterium RIFCSPHIGHO2_01_FULL_43_31]
MVNRYITQSNKVRMFIWIVLIVLGVPLLSVTLILGLFYATVPLHNLSLWRMERVLALSITHPLNSSVVERHSFLGTRYTNTSECTYVAGEFRSTSLSREELLSVYKDATVDIFGFTRAMPVHVVIAELDAPLSLDDPATNWIVNFAQSIGTHITGTTYYLVYLYEKGRFPWGDYRCIE